MQDNEVFIRMLEKYFQSVSPRYYNGEKVSDIHPERAFQVRIFNN
jgi:hypothetical protein